MAEKGTYAAYAPLKGVGEQTTRNLQHAEYMGFRYRQEEAQAKERKSRNTAELAKQMGLDMAALSFKDSGVKSVDAPLYEYFSNAKGQVGELYQKLEANPDDFETRILLEKKMNAAKTLAGFTQRYADYQQDFKKGISEGTYSEYLNKGVPDKINQSLKQGKYKIVDDKNGEQQILVDMDGDGEINDVLALNAQEFIAGNELYAPKKATSKVGAMDAIAGQFGIVETEDDLSGSKTTIYKGFDPNNIPALKEEVNFLLGENKEQMTEAAMSIIADDMKLGDPATMTDDEFKEFKDKFSQAIINKFDKKESNTIDRADQDRDREFYYGVQQDKLDREEAAADKKAALDAENKTNATDRIEVMTGETGSTNAEGKTLFSLPKTATLESEGGEINTLKVEMDGEKLVFWGTQKGPEKDDPVVQKRVTRDDQKNIIVRGMSNPETGKNFTGLSEFYNHLNKIKATEGLPDL